MRGHPRTRCVGRGTGAARRTLTLLRLPHFNASYLKGNHQGRDSGGKRGGTGEGVLVSQMAFVLFSSDDCAL